jgi:hypothetical protein
MRTTSLAPFFGTPAPSLRRRLIVAGVLLLIGAISNACAEEESSAPPTIDIKIDFQSTAAAVSTDTVKIYVFEGLATTCNDLIRLRQTEQPLPARVAETSALTPCQLQRNELNSLELSLKKDYTMLAIGQIGGKDVLAGCSQQPAYGETIAVDITLALIDDKQKLNPPECAKLSDKCNGGCR